MKKALFLVSAKYPLINSINIKMNMLKGKNADIMLDTNQSNVQEICDRMSTIKIFEKIFIVDIRKTKGVKYFFKLVMSGEKTEKFIWYLKNSLIDLKYNIISFFDKKYKVNSRIINNEKMNFSDYDEIYLCCENKIALTCVGQIAKLNFLQKINLIEEGIREYYVDSVIKKMSRLYSGIIIDILLYEPSWVVYDKNIINGQFRKIPKLSPDDKNLVKCLNIVFGFTKIENKNFWNNKIIFFDQVYEPMPDYLKNARGLKKFLLHNTYKKHQKEHFKYEEKCKCLESLNAYTEKTGLKEHFAIKLHPRTLKGLEEDYKQYVVGDVVNDNNIPWEVYMLNDSFANNIWISKHSSSVLNSLYSFDETFNKQNNIFILLFYKMDLDISIDLKKFLMKIEKIFFENVVSLNNEADIYNYLLEKYKLQ